MKEYQITLFCASNKYKPVSCIVKVDDEQPFDKKAVQKQGIIKICQKRCWTQRELKKYEYTKVKIREYDKERIEAEKAERYEQIKKERGWA